MFSKDNDDESDEADATEVNTDMEWEGQTYKKNCPQKAKNSGRITGNGDKKPSSETATALACDADMEVEDCIDKISSNTNRRAVFDSDARVLEREKYFCGGNGRKVSGDGEEIIVSIAATSQNHEIFMDCVANHHILSNADLLTDIQTSGRQYSVKGFSGQKESSNIIGQFGECGVLARVQT